MVASYQGLGGRTGGGYYLLLCFLCLFLFVLLSFGLLSCLFFKWVEHDSSCVCFFLYYSFSLSPVPLTRSYWGIEIVVFNVTLFIKSVSDHYSVDFFGKGRVFYFESLFRLFALLYKYHKSSRSSLSFHLAGLLTVFILFHALMLVAHWECKLPPLNDTGKD